MTDMMLGIPMSVCKMPWEKMFVIGNDDIESNGRRFQGTPSDVAATMRNLIKSQEEQHQLNAAMLQSLIDLQTKIDSGRRTARPEGSMSSARRRRRNYSGSSEFE